MKRWSHCRMQPASDEHKARLAAWLREWDIDRALADDDDQETAASAPVPMRAGAEHPCPAARDIRLLMPLTPGARAHPRYMALLRREDDGRWLVAPFGRLATPAWPGEWRTSRNEPPLRVLCLWNAARLSEGLLLSSWKVDELSDKDAACALAAWRAWSPDQGARSSGDPRVGPPLSHPLDPRHDYLEEERAWMDDVRGGATPSSRGALLLPEAGDQWPLAAEDPEDYDGDHSGGDRPPDGETNTPTR